MRVRRSVRAIALPVALIMATGAGLASVPVPAAARASRPGKVALNQPGADASSVVSVRSWGDNSAGELGDGSLTGQTTPVPVARLSGAAAISANGRHDLALLANGTVMSWGDGAFGQLGNGTTSTLVTPTAVTGLGSVQAISAGGADAAAIVASPGGGPVRPVPSIWRVIRTPDPHPAAISDRLLAGVSAASPASAWAVGYSQQGTQRPLAERWNGRSWSRASVPMPSGTGEATLSGVDDLSPSDAWAVGTSETTSGTGERTLIEHWDGTAWSVVPSPNPFTGPGAFDELAAIGGTGPDDLWAVGSFSAGTNFIALLFEHWNGTSWSNVATPFLQTTDSTNALTEVSAAAGHAGRVGDLAWDRAVACGWTDEQLAEAFAYLALTVFTGYFLNYARTELDLPVPAPAAQG